MVSTAYSEAAKEVLAILDNTEAEAVNKISKKFLNFLKENASKTYKPEFDTTKPIKELKLKPKTEALLGMIYLNYWANEEERVAFKNKVKENEINYQKELKQRYNSDNIFKRHTTMVKEKQEDIQMQEAALTKNKKDTLIQKIKNKIKKIFRR
ncbi:MAG: hypothetical protein HFJ37_04015 [Clostridia bacterium]|nr:hypothetical protein [Clostridia bacterium]